MFDNKKIYIIGMARSGYEVAKFLSGHGCHIVVTDTKEQDEEAVQELESLGVKVIIDQDQCQYLDDTFDCVIKNPGAAITHPIYEKAKKYHIPVINEVEVAYHYLPENVKIIGVTGSNGKTTTTTLIHQFLVSAGLPAVLGGNIGYPVCSVIPALKEGGILVLELSCQQLYDMYDFKTDVSVLTNLIPVHLDHFGNYENYIHNKLKVFQHHTADDLAALNADNEDVVTNTLDIPSHKIFFSAQKDADVCIHNQAIYYLNEPIVEVDDIRIKGTHNYENIMCAIAAAKPFGVTNETIREVLNNFPGVEHRIEFVKKVEGREFYNDSKATNVKSTQIALSSFKQPVILLLGGLDRGHSFDELETYMGYVKDIICYGETKNRIKQFADRIEKECFVTDTLEEATKIAYNLSEIGDIILLSPSCASWDQYKSFEERGDAFKEIVERL